MDTAKKTILFTSHTANFQKFNQPLIQMLSGRLSSPYESLNMGGWVIHYASAGEEKIPNIDKNFKIDFARNPLRLDKHIKSYKQLKKILNNYHYDIIHTHTPVGAVITRLAAKKSRKSGTKVIYTSHGFHFYTGAPISGWLLWYPIEKIMAHYTDILVTINEEDFARAKAFKTKAKLIHGVGVDTKVFNNKTTSKLQLNTRNQLGLSQDNFVISYLAELNKNKNHETIIKSLENAKTQKSNTKVLFLGKGKLQKKLEKLSNKLGVKDNVLFLGYKDNVADILHISNLYVSTSIREGLGMGVLQAVACGVPIVISNNRGHREIVNNNQKYLFDANNSKFLCKKILSAQNSKDYHIEFASKYSLTNSLRTMRKIYQELAS